MVDCQVELDVSSWIREEDSVAGPSLAGLFLCQVVAIPGPPLVTGGGGLPAAARFVGGVSHLDGQDLPGSCLCRCPPSFQHWCLERGTFRYHLRSASRLACFFAPRIDLPSKQVGVVAASGTIVSLHGIYSLSFLELWSLAQGGYAASILRQCALRGSLGENIGLLDLQQLGESKRNARVGRTLISLFTGLRRCFGHER